MYFTIEELDELEKHVVSVTVTQESLEYGADDYAMKEIFKHFEHKFAYKDGTFKFEDFVVGSNNDYDNINLVEFYGRYKPTSKGVLLVAGPANGIRIVTAKAGAEVVIPVNTSQDTYTVTYKPAGYMSEDRLWLYTMGQ